MTEISSPLPGGASHPASMRRFWLAVVAMAALYFFLQVLPLLAAGGGNQNDFKHIYLGAYLLAQGGDPYNAETLQEMGRIWRSEDGRFASGVLPYVYLPFTGQVLRPLAWMNFGTAAQLWMLLNHAMFIGALVLAARAGGWRATPCSVLLIGAFVVFNYALFRQNNAGQLNMVLALGYALVALGLVRGWSARVVGSLAAVLALFKLSPGILLVYFLVTRRWHHAGWMVGTGVTLGLISATMAGWGTTLNFLPLLGEMGYGKSTWSEFGHTFWRDPYNQSLNAFLHRVLVEWPGYEPWVALGPGVANGLTLGLSLGLLGILGVALGKGAALESPDSDRIRGEMALVILASLLLPSLMWDHYLAQGVIALLLVWGIGGPGWGWWKVVLGGVAVVWSLGIFFDSGRIHPGILVQPLLVIPGVPGMIGGSPLLSGIAGGFGLPGGRWMGPVWESLKLWPTLLLFGLCAGRLLRWKGSESRSAVKP